MADPIAVSAQLLSHFAFNALCSVTSPSMHWVTVRLSRKESSIGNLRQHWCGIQDQVTSKGLQYCNYSKPVPITSAELSYHCNQQRTGETAVIDAFSYDPTKKPGHQRITAEPGHRSTHPMCCQRVTPANPLIPKSDIVSSAPFGHS